MSIAETPGPAAVAAANWWANAVGAPRFDNGDGMSGMLATLLSAQAPVSTGSTAAFAEALAGLVQADLTRLAGLFEDGPYITLDVDYGPDRVLSQAAEIAKVSSARFPWKTMMWVRLDHVTVSSGYQAPTVLVWASDEWLANRPLCSSQKYDEGKYATVENYGGEPWRCSLPMFHDGVHAFDRPLTLCVKCGRPDGFWHSDERAHMRDFHTFVAASSVSA